MAKKITERLISARLTEIKMISGSDDEIMATNSEEMGVIKGSSGNYKILLSTMPHRAGICSSSKRDFLETNSVSANLLTNAAIKFTDAGHSTWQLHKKYNWGENI